MPPTRTRLYAGLGGVSALAAAALPRLLDGPLAQPFGTGLGVAAVALLLLALRRWSIEGDDCGRRGLGRRYARELSLGMGGYVLALLASLLLLRQVDQPLLRALLALLPVLPIVLVLRAMIRYVRDSDELQRRIELEAISFASASVSLLYMTGGFLQPARVIDVPAAAAMLWVFPLTCLVYGAAKALVARRYG